MIANITMANPVQQQTANTAAPPSDSDGQQFMQILSQLSKDDVLGQTSKEETKEEDKQNQVINLSALLISSMMVPIQSVTQDVSKQPDVQDSTLPVIQIVETEQLKQIPLQNAISALQSESVEKQSSATPQTVLLENELFKQVVSIQFGNSPPKAENPSTELKIVQNFEVKQLLQDSQQSKTIQFQQPTTQQPTTQQSITQQPSAQQPITVQQLTQQSITQQSAAQQLGSQMAMQSIAKSIQTQPITDISQQPQNSLQQIQKPLQNETQNINITAQTQNSQLEMQSKTSQASNASSQNSTSMFESSDLTAAKTLKPEQETVVIEPFQSRYTTQITGLTKAENANPADALLTDITPQVTQGVVKGIQNGDQTMTIKLRPEGLGEITVKLISQDGGLTLSITSANERTVKILQNQLSELKLNLQGQNLTITKVSASFESNIHSDNMAQNNLMGGQQSSNFQNSFSGFGKQPNSNSQSQHDSAYAKYTQLKQDEVKAQMAQAIYIHRGLINYVV